MADLVLKNGKVLLPSGEVSQVDVVISDGKIEAILKEGFSGMADREIDLSGKHILPGCIDAHVHFRDPGKTHKEDFTTGSLAALHGGVTTILDMPNVIPSTVTIEALAERKALAAADCKCNYGFYFGVSEAHFSEIGEALKDPFVHGLKVFLAMPSGDFKVSYEFLEKVFAKYDALYVVHAEDLDCVMKNAEKFEGETDPLAHSKVRSPECASIAVRKVLHLAKKYDRRVHILHVSSAMELEVIRKFKNDKVTCEVTPHHLFLDVSEYGRQGARVKMDPPLRDKEDREAMFEALDEGLVDVIATDHAPHTIEENEKGYPETPSGVPGIETMLPLMLNEVSRGRFTLAQVSNFLSSRPAEIFGFPQKGQIKKGFDADLVVCDMDLLKEVRNEDLKTKCQWSPFNGWKLKGWPVMTICNGKVFEF